MLIRSYHHTALQVVKYTHRSIQLSKSNFQNSKTFRYTVSINSILNVTEAQLAPEFIEVDKIYSRQQFQSSVPMSLNFINWQSYSDRNLAKLIIQKNSLLNFFVQFLFCTTETKLKLRHYSPFYQLFVDCFFV